MKGRANLNDAVMLSGWPTTRVSTNGMNGRADWAARARLEDVVLLATWRSPAVSDAEGGPCEAVFGQDHPRLNLRSQVILAAWPTTGACDSTRRVPESPESKRARGRKTGMTLLDIAALSSWASPAARDWRDGRASQETMARNSRPLNEQTLQLLDTGPMPSGSGAKTRGSVQLNPAHSRWLMGLPREWDDCGVTAIRLLPRKRRRS